MAKKGENKMLIPPDGGEWTFNMKSGATHYGLLMVRFDDGVLIDAGNGIFAALMNDSIESMWQGLAVPEGYKQSV